MNARSVTRGLLAAGLAVALPAMLTPARAQAAGMITHAWMADAAIERVSDPELRELLETHRHEVLSGASYEVRFNAVARRDALRSRAALRRWLCIALGRR